MSAEARRGASDRGPEGAARLGADGPEVAGVSLASRMVCAGCGRALAPDDPRPYRCPAADAEPAVDHVLARELDLAGTRLVASDVEQPFVRYRELLHAWRLGRRAGLADLELVEIVHALDAAVERVDGRGFRRTPLVDAPELAGALGVAGVALKDETRNVTGTHKGRHLFGLALWLRVVERAGLAADTGGPLAIASCGNAALAAATLARALGRPLEVFVPPDAPPSTLARLAALGARLTVCAREPGAPPGDPCVRRFRAAVRAGAVPFGCQGDANGLAVEGGHTLGWELAEQLPEGLAKPHDDAREASLDRLLVQVGGGALASGVVAGLREALALGALARLPRVHAVQAAACHPLALAWRRVAEDLAAELGLEAGGTDAELAARLERHADAAAIARAMRAARARRSDYMRPWPSAPASLAAAIQDDETYDWAVPVEAMLATGGWPVVVSEDSIRQGTALARSATGLDVCPSGAAGLAGALALAAAGHLEPTERVGLLFTGAPR